GAVAALAFRGGASGSFHQHRDQSPACAAARLRRRGARCAHPDVVTEFPTTLALSAVQNDEVLVKDGRAHKAAWGRRDAGRACGREPNTDWVWRWVRQGQLDLRFAAGDGPLTHPAG